MKILNLFSREKKVKHGSRVRVNYKCSDSEGNIIDSNKDHTLTVGNKTDIEKAILGLKIGDSATFKRLPESIVDTKNEYPVPIDKLPDAPIEEGMTISLMALGGKEVPARIKEIKDGNAIVTLNHPLNKELIFNVKVVEIY